MILKDLHGIHRKRIIAPSSLLWGEARFPRRTPTLCSPSTLGTTSPCTKKNLAWRRCKCPKWIQGTLDSGEFVRRSAKTRSWAKAQKQVNQIENPDPAKTPQSSSPVVRKPKPDPKRCAISTAVEKFLDDAKSRGLKDSTRGKLKTLCERQLLKWAKKESVTRARRSKHHDEPSVTLDHQLIQHHFTGIRNQCSSLHRHEPETARACPTSIPPYPARKSINSGSSKVTKNLSMAAFEVITYGRFWVIAEASRHENVTLRQFRNSIMETVGI